MDSAQASKSTISKPCREVPVIGTLSTAEYRKLRRLLHDLARRNIYMRFKYIARLYHSGMLEQIVASLNATSKTKENDPTMKIYPILNGKLRMVQLRDNQRTPMKMIRIYPILTQMMGTVAMKPTKKTMTLNKHT